MPERRDASEPDDLPADRDGDPAADDWDDLAADRGDEGRPPDEKFVPSPAPGLGPIGPAGDPAYMEGTLEGRGPKVGLYITVGVIAVLVVVAIALVLAGS